MILHANARHLPLADRSVQCVVTSPPYFGLRDYGHAGQLGLETTPAAYVASLVEVFREVRRVLRDDGTVWLNLGDSYASQGGVNKSPMATSGLNGAQTSAAYRERLERTQGGRQQLRQPPPPGLKAKDLIGIPWRVAFALQDDGWYLRQDIIWHKPNPMPESVTDRCTRAHEYLFLLSKRPKYYFDADAIKEPSVEPERGPRKDRFGGNKHGAHSTKHSDGSIWTGEVLTRNRRSVWSIAPKPYRGAHFAVFPEALVEPCVLAGSKPGDRVLDPFSGSGTTVTVANRLGRQGLGTELNPEYHALAVARITGTAPPPKPVLVVPPAPVDTSILDHWLDAFLSPEAEAGG